MKAKLAVGYCKLCRKAACLLLPLAARWHRFTRRAGSSRNRIGVYSAYFNSSPFLPAHLESLRRTADAGFDYYLMKNFTIPDEGRQFDDIVARYPFVKAFGGIAGKLPCPLSHGDSLQRLVSLTDNEIIVMCDVDSLFLAQGWDTFVLRQLQSKQVIGVAAHFALRGLPFVLHPSFIACKRQFIEDNGIDLRSGDGNDPAYKITKFLMQRGMLDERYVHLLVPTQVEYPNGWFTSHPFPYLAGKPSHGFCTRYGDFFFHFWHSRQYLEGTDIMGDDGLVLAPYSAVKERVAYYTGPYTQS